GEPELAELPVGAGDGLPVDAERAREIADGGQPGAGRNTSGLDPAPQVVDELAVQGRRAGTALQRDDHGPTVTRMIALVKQANMVTVRGSIGPAARTPRHPRLLERRVRPLAPTPRRDNPPPRLALRRGGVVAFPPLEEDRWSGSPRTGPTPRCPACRWQRSAADRPSRAVPRRRSPTGTRIPSRWAWRRPSTACAASTDRPSTPSSSRPPRTRSRRSRARR